MKNIFVVGLGLIGASLCRAIKQPDIKLYGWDFKEESCQIALETGIVDEVVAGLDSAVEMDIIILAVPVGVSLEYLQELAKLPLKENVLVTDVGSTKSAVVQLADTLPFTFVGGHPMSGSHKSGVKAANPNLFEKAYYILTPSGEQQAAVDQLIELLTPTRAKFVVLDPSSHDEMVGVLSHLPHIVASGLVQMSDQLAQTYPRAKQLAAGGFRDITRIASSDPRMWTDVLLTNREILLDLMDKWQAEMTEIKHQLEQNDRGAIHQFFSRAKLTRDQLPAKDQGAIPAFYDLLVDIPDIAGAVAQVTTVLSQNHISIINLKIQETREDIFGVLELSFKNKADLLAGKALVESEKFHCRIRS
ncbi:prephenate dehydrogenase [Enterococcus sp. 669A]|uniref:Prephenate dehydrogenase n=1 Tax=Candidatus Enterococcus moelleringii TaxID=2815325 RepID=A0ABS3LCB6_9ENTE|nr:prephenate dehydrogenase [Enterococcus sp. 669A]MBO1307274.1 prephenate dehydrogenase [Enterococcus sp. 669A]